MSEKKKTGKESQYIVSRPETGSDPPIGSDRESGCDMFNFVGSVWWNNIQHGRTDVHMKIKICVGY